MCQCFALTANELCWGGGWGWCGGWGWGASSAQSRQRHNQLSVFGATTRSATWRQTRSCFDTGAHPNNCRRSTCPSRTQAADSQQLPRIARQLAPALLQLLRAHARFARWSVFRVPPFSCLYDHDDKALVLTSTLGLVTQVAAAITGSCKRAAAGKLASGSCTGRWWGGFLRCDARVAING